MRRRQSTVDSQKLQTAVDGELLYVVATTDTERKWTMAELLSTYKRQSVIERCWRCCKNPTMMVDSMYLQKPSRIDALLWLMQTAGFPGRLGRISRPRRAEFYGQRFII